MSFDRDKIKAVLVDIDDTLLDFTKSANEAVLRSGKDLNLELPDNMCEIFHRINPALWREIEAGKLTREELHKIRFNIMFKEAGVDFEGPVFEARFRENLRHSAVRVDGSSEMLEYLSKKYVLGTASNAQYEQQVMRLSEAGLAEYFTYFFISERLKAEKPSPLFFNRCLEGLGREPEEVVMIGDNYQADIKGAAYCGIKTVWFNKRNEKIPEDPVFDHTVTDLCKVRYVL